MFGNNPFNEHRAAQKVQEISKGKLDQYVKGAEKDKIKKYAQSDMGKVSKDDAHKNQEKRNKGIDMAKSKMKPAKVASNESVSESKFVIPEEIPANERTAFHGAAAAAAKAGKSHFNFGGKKHPVTMKKDTAKAIADDAAVTVKGTPRAGNNPFRGGRPTVKTEGIYKDMDTEKSEPSPRSDAKVKSDFKKRRKTADKTDVNMNPKMDGAKDKSAMETKESTIREKLMAVLEGDKAKHYKGATKPETMDDKLSGKGAKDMMNQPQEIDDTEKKGHDDSVKAGRAGPGHSKPRSGGDNTKKGDMKIIPSATPIKNIKGTMEAYASMYAPKLKEEIEESYTHEVDYAEDGKHTAKKFVATAKKAGIKAKIHNPRGPGGGHPVVHLGHKDTKHMHKFLKKHYDPDMEHDDLDAHKI